MHQGEFLALPEVETEVEVVQTYLYPFYHSVTRGLPFGDLELQRAKAGTASVGFRIAQGRLMALTVQRGGWVDNCRRMRFVSLAFAVDHHLAWRNRLQPNLPGRGFQSGRRKSLFRRQLQPLLFRQQMLLRAPQLLALITNLNRQHVLVRRIQKAGGER